MPDACLVLSYLIATVLGSQRSLFGDIILEIHYHLSKKMSMKIGLLNWHSSLVKWWLHGGIGGIWKHQKMGYD